MYLQSQNGNLYTNDFFTTGTSSTEFEPLRKNVPSEVSWCSRAFGTLGFSPLSRATLMVIVCKVDLPTLSISG